MAAQAQQVGRAGVAPPGDRVEVELDHVVPQLALGRRLREQFGLADGRNRDIDVGVRRQCVGCRVVGRVWARKPDLQEQRVLVLAVADPPAGGVADEVVRVHVGILIPDERAQRALVAFGVGRVPVVAAGLDQLARAQGLVPLVVDGAVALFQEQGPVLVLHDQALVKPPGRVVGVDVHLADVHAVIALIGQRTHPGGLPGLEIAEHLAAVRVLAREEAGAGAHAHGRRDEALGEGRPVAGQAIEMRRLHPRRPQRADRVGTLLVGHDENDVGALHRFNPASAPGS